VAFPWAHARPSTVDERIGSFFQNHTGRHVTTAAGKSFFVPGVGYHAALIDKLNADRHIRRHTSGAAYDYIMYFDSDNLLTRPLTHADVFERYRGSSDPQTDRASRYQLHLPAVAWARYGAMHEAAWRSRLASMLGLSVPETRYTTMCRGGGLTYPAWMHSELRAHLHQVMGGRTLHEHAAHLLEDRKAHDHMAADYELMGGYLLYIAKGRGGVAWEVEDGSEEHPWGNQTHRADGTSRLPFPVLQRNSWSSNGFPLDKRLEYECILGANSRMAAEYQEWRLGVRLALGPGNVAVHPTHSMGWCEGLQAYTQLNKGSIGPQRRAT